MKINFLDTQAYSMSKDEKQPFFLSAQKELTEYHRNNCIPYRRMLDSMGFNQRNVTTSADIPFLPVGLFKRLRLVSGEAEGNSVLTSSGTGGIRSQVSLNAETAQNQRMALANITSDFLGGKRLPMLVLDTPDVLKPPLRQTARGAGVAGFSVCGRHRVFALNKDMSLNVNTIREFLQSYGDSPFFVFGFTFLVWKNLVLECEKNGVTFDMRNGTLIHGGGWKKLVDCAVSREEFHSRLERVCGLKHIHDYYGMAEQAGSVFMECEYGHLHASIFSEVYVLNPTDFLPCSLGERGIIAVQSLLPTSYPGHSLLTQDEGVLLGEDDCPCGRKGRYFKVLGRLPKAEIRGCSDVY